MKTFHIGGVHPQDKKLNIEAPSSLLPLPKQVCVMVNQHLGAPSQILVKKGDMVKVGQLLTSNEAFLGSVVHSPVSGIVNKIGEAIDTSLYPKAAIYIDVEGDQWEDFIDQSPEIKREIVLSKAEIIQRIKEMGIVGLGGACFPTHVKINISKTCKAEYLLINGVECEPFLTDDYRLILEKGEEILIGISILMKALEVKQALIGIENNKPKAIAYLSELAKSFPGISVHPLKMKYPQGAEKQLIKALVNKEVPSGKLPISVGCVVNNVGTCQAVYQAVQKHKPLVERMVTVTGVQVAEPRNFWVRIGTPISELIEACGGLPKDTAKIISGGPMMGKALSDINTPVTKGVSAVLLVPEAEAHRREVHPCIRCGKCVEACPMGLEPYLISASVEHGYFDRTENAKIMDCIECGCCQYTCPSNRYLLDNLRMGKATVGNIIKKRNAKN